MKETKSNDPCPKINKTETRETKIILEIRSQERKEKTDRKETV